MFMPLQAGSWLMSIFAIFGAAPVKVTVPLTVAAVAGSIGVAAGAGADIAPPAGAGAALDSSFDFLLQPVSSTRPTLTRAHRPSKTIHGFRFMISMYLS